MKHVTIEKQILLTKIKSNLAIHKSEYAEAKTLMEEEVKKYHQKQLRLVKKGDDFDSYFSFDVPENHESDYIQVINMLEMTVDNLIELSYNEFTKYVMDNWDWTHSFKLSASNYGATVSNFD